MERYTFNISSIESGNVKEIDIKNDLGAVLRFKVDIGGNLNVYYLDLAFILYEFRSGWIRKITTFGPDGKMGGPIDFNDRAKIIFIIKKPVELRSKLKIIDEAEGNIAMNDTDEELVLQRNFNSKNELIKEYYISSDDYWDMHHLQFRP